MQLLLFKRFDAISFYHRNYYYTITIIILVNEFYFNQLGTYFLPSRHNRQVIIGNMNNVQTVMNNTTFHELHSINCCLVLYSIIGK